MTREIDFPKPSRRRFPWRGARMSDRGKTRLYYAAAVCLLIAAAALRFYDLPGNSITFDEATAANNSRGSLSSVLARTRDSNTSPILYPLVLYAVQKVESSPLSVRIVPAAASVLTIAALLFLLPRVGVSRWAAFIAALLAAGSVNSIWNAQDVREYSVDALVAVLMTAGLLSYLQEKRRHTGMYALFCVSLFVAPLVQYGLVLFGAAVFGTIAVMEGKTLWIRRDTLRDGLRFREGWVWDKIGYLAWPVVSFAAGSVLSYAATVRYHWSESRSGVDSYLSWAYYSGEYTDIPAVMRFVLSRTEAVFHYHTTEFLTIAGLAGFGIFLLVSFKKARLGAVPTLFLFSFAVAACAALLRMYPYGETRQCMYLGPIIFLGFGHALHSIAVDASSLTRSAWTARAGMAAAAGVIAFSGASAIRDTTPYGEYENMNRILAVLEERMQPEDAVYVSGAASSVMRFYNPQQPSNYYYGNNDCKNLVDIGICIGDIRETVDRQTTDRIWTIGSLYKMPSFKLLEEFQNGILVEHAVDGHRSDLYLIQAPDLLDRLEEPMGSLKREGEPIITSNFDVYIRGDALAYVKEPCSPSDAAPRFFLHVTPVDVDDLSDDRRGHGFDNLDFQFGTYGTAQDGKCAAVRNLPKYGIESIWTGQFSEADGRIWQGEFIAGKESR